MSNSSNLLRSLLEKQDQERKHLAEAAHEAWVELLKVEHQLLAPYHGEYESAPKDIRKIHDHKRMEYWDEWSSGGKLATLMKERHEKEREELVKRNLILERLRQAKERNRTKSKDRERDD